MHDLYESILFILGLVLSCLGDMFVHIVFDKVEDFMNTYIFQKIHSRFDMHML